MRFMRARGVLPKRKKKPAPAPAPARKRRGRPRKRRPRADGRPGKPVASAETFASGSTRAVPARAFPSLEGKAPRSPGKNDDDSTIASAFSLPPVPQKGKQVPVEFPPDPSPCVAASMRRADVSRGSGGTRT